MATEGFGERVLRARLEMGARLSPPRQITQAEIGAKLGVSGVAVGTWEAGKKEPDLDTIVRLAYELGVRASWLAFNDGPMRDGGEKRPTADQDQRTTVVNGVTSERPKPHKRKRA